MNLTHPSRTRTGHALPPPPSVVVPVVSVGADGMFALGIDGGSALTWQIAVSPSPSGSGAVSGSGTYADATPVTVTAVASPGYVFGNWTEGGVVVSGSPSYTFAASTDRVLVAAFVPAVGGYSVSTGSQPTLGGGTGGDGIYASGGSATVTATPNPGYKFSKWIEGGTTVSTTRNFTFTVLGNRVLVAKFKPVFHVQVTVGPEGGGEAEADSSAYEPGDTAVLKAVPASGYSFLEWTQDGVRVSTAATYSFTVTANRELVAHFAPGHRIEATSIPPAAGATSGDGVYASGSTALLVASANPGYVFLNWTENGTVVSTEETAAVVSDGDHALVANFSALPALTPAVLPGGSLVLSWPAGATDWVLQENPDLAAGSWADSTAVPGVVGSIRQVTLPFDSPRRFFRLVHP